jgi:hypothetical protein
VAGFPDFFLNMEPLSGISEVIPAMDTRCAKGAWVFFVDYLQLVSEGNDEGIYRETSIIATAMRRNARQ